MPGRQPGQKLFTFLARAFDLARPGVAPPLEKPPDIAKKLIVRVPEVAGDVEERVCDNVECSVTPSRFAASIQTDLKLIRHRPALL